jgi:magnesium-transporting ATPase (P-type)
MIAAFGLDDPIRANVNEGILKLTRNDSSVGEESTSINVRMISGDNIHTATFKAMECEIIGEDGAKEPGVCMNGDEFRRRVGAVHEHKEEDGTIVYKLQNGNEFKKIMLKLKVLARSTPEDKYAFIVGLQQQGATVAVTADGMSDAKAL